MTSERPVIVFDVNETLLDITKLEPWLCQKKLT